jgi:hypothetical protein
MAQQCLGDEQFLGRGGQRKRYRKTVNLHEMFLRFMTHIRTESPSNRIMVCFPPNRLKEICFKVKIVSFKKKRTTTTHQ